jgi:uncharacterized protein (DUF1499 family)
MKIVALIAAFLALALAGVAVWVRIAPSDPAVWHVDPAKVAQRGPRNSFLLAPGGDAAALTLAEPPDAVAARLEAIALATPRTTRLAGQGTFATYITRSALFGFPDYTSVHVLPAEGGSQVLIFARSRFGDGDMGVNRARVEDWTARLIR